MSELPLIIEAENLKPILGRSDLLLVDLCSPERYAEGHIPGAVYVSPRELVRGTPPAPGQLPDLPQLEALMERLGVNEDTTVIAYDGEGGGWAGRFIWTLEVIGHRKASYLNGGIWAWIASGGELTDEPGSRAPVHRSLRIDHEAIASKQHILDRLQDESFLVWDARGPLEYDGSKTTAQRNGHIPGAIHCEWTELMDRNAELRIRSDARDYLANKGITADKEIVTHCHSHHRSGFTWLVGKMLGFNIKAYPGSWAEWGNDPSTPIETGNKQ